MASGPRRGLLAAALLLLGLASRAAAQTPALTPDVVILINQDRISGEIKSYASGRLKVVSDHEGDVSIKWNKILSISSDKVFNVEMTSGIHHFGRLEPSDPPGKLRIVSETGTIDIGFLEVAWIAPLRAIFWQRIDGTLDLGFNYTAASELVQFHLSADATYRTRNWELQSNLSSFLSRQGGETDSQRGSLSFLYQRNVTQKWIAAGGLGFDRNFDLGLELRASAVVGGGRKIIQTNQTQFVALVGISGNHETPVAGDSQYNVELLLAAYYSSFTYDFPKVNIDANLQILPSLTESGRVRIEGFVKGRREIARDFYVSLSLFDSFDSQDPTTGESRNDWGPVLSIGWTF